MSLFDTLLGGYGADQQLENITDAGKTAQNVLGDMAATLPEYTQFKPFTVTTSGGRVNATPEGGYTTSLSPEMQAMQQQLFGGAKGMFGQVTQPLEDRQRAVYDQIRALQSPEEERQRLELENRMFNQGRLGVQTAQYGGTPEQLAMAKAQEEARNQAALSALTQAQAEQAQAFDIGQGMLKAGYSPGSMLLNTLQPAVNMSQTATQAGSNLGGMLANLAGAQATAGINTETLRNAIIQQAIQATSASGAPASAQEWLGEKVGGSLGDWLVKNAGGLLSGGTGSGTNNFSNYLSSIGSTGNDWTNWLNTQPDITVNTQGLGAGYNFGQPVNWFEEQGR